VTMAADRHDADPHVSVAQRLDTSFVVAGGPGTGTTAALIDRVVGLLQGGNSPDEVAVVLATPAAATDFARRLARAAEAAEARSPAGLTTLATAVRRIEATPVGELAAWMTTSTGRRADRRVLHGADDRAGFDIELGAALDRVLDDPAAETVLARALALGLDPVALEEVAWRLHRQPDRLVPSVATSEPVPSDPDRGDPWRMAPVDAARVIDALDAAIALSAQCTDDEDLLREHLTGRLTEGRRQLVEAPDDATLLSLLVRLPSFSSAFGRRDNWNGRSAEARAACAAAEEARRTALRHAADPVARWLTGHLIDVARAIEARRLHRGTTQDTEVRAEAFRMLDDPTACAELRRRVRHVLVDDLELAPAAGQELAQRLSAAVLEGRPAAAASGPALTVVLVRPPVALTFELTEAVFEVNVRSVPGIVSFTAVLADAYQDMRSGWHAGEPARAAARTAHASGVRGGAGVQLSLPGLHGDHERPPALELPPVVILGRGIEGAAGEVRATAGRDVAAAISRAVAEGWPATEAGDAGVNRPMRFGDVVVAVADRRALPALEEAMENAGVPFRLADPALLWGCEVVRDMLAVLAAVDDPNDEVAVLAALRSPGLGCGDDDLVAWRSAGGSWDPTADPPPDMESHPVSRAMDVLAKLHGQSASAGPADVVHQAIIDLRAFELALALPGAAGQWHRLQWLAQQAEVFEERSGSTFRRFVRWAERRVRSAAQPLGLDSDTTGVDLPDGSAAVIDDAVRVTTVRTAVTLEAPMVVLTGLASDEPVRTAPVLWTGSEPEVHLGGALRTDGYDEAASTARSVIEAERRRLVWLAMTRARDHLVVSLHHRIRDAAPESGPAAHLIEVCRAHPLLWRRIPEANTPDPGPAPIPPAPASADTASAWRDEVAAFEHSRAELRRGREHLDVIRTGAPEAGPDGPPPPFEGALGWLAGRRHHDVPVVLVLDDATGTTGGPGLFETVVPMIVEDGDELVVVGKAPDTEVDRPSAWRELGMQADALARITGRAVGRGALVGTNERVEELTGDRFETVKEEGRRALTEMLGARA